MQTVLVVDTDGFYRTRYLINVPAARRSPAATVACSELGKVKIVGGQVVGIFGCASNVSATNNLLILASNGVTPQDGDPAYSDCRYIV